jgi:cobalt-zinc-cadmium efflux system outer membrane protein
MNNFIRWITVSVFLLMPALIHAQSSTITLEKAVALFEENSLQQELAKLDALRKKGEATRYKSYLNPEISVFREQLNAGTLDYQETTYQISQPIELLGQPFLRSRSASRTKEAADLDFAYNRQQLINRVKWLYAEYWYLKNKVEIYDEAVAAIQKIRQAAADRKEEGTVSGLELQRFNVALSQYKKDRDQVRINLQQTGSKLRALIFAEPQPTAAFNVQDTLRIRPPAAEKAVLIQRALQKRTDYEALNKLSEASDLQLKVEKRDRLPDLNVDFGYKNQSDGSEGFVIGGSIKVPIFNQNSGNVTIARAEARSRQTSVQMKQQQIRNEVETAYQRVQLLMEQWQSQQEQAIKPSFLETARFSYSEGAYSLIELLDALKAYVEGRSITYETISAYNQALNELDLVSGGTLNSTLNTQN